MSRQRKGKTTQKFYCPFCQQRLWRLGSQKYYLISQGKAESQSSHPSKFTASQKIVNAARDCWLEEFYCEEHGKLWMLLSKAFDDSLAIASI
jgi:hypothetical protein